MTCKICGTNHREPQDHPYTGTLWIFLPKMSDGDLLRAFDKDALLTLDAYGAMWERGLMTYSDKAVSIMGSIGEW